MTTPYRTPWQRLLDGDYSYRIVPQSLSDAANFYWCTDIKTPEIAEAFPAYDIGVALLDGAACSSCQDQIVVLSRCEAERRAKDFHESMDRPGRHRPRSTMCKACYKQDRDADSAGFHAEMALRDARLKELRVMPYRDYLQTPEWKNTREDALKRARYSCQTCSSKDRLQVHHRTYARRGAEYSTDLTVLCFKCHEVFHDRMQLAEGGRASLPSMPSANEVLQ